MERGEIEREKVIGGDKGRKRAGEIERERVGKIERERNGKIEREGGDREKEREKEREERIKAKSTKLLSQPSLVNHDFHTRQSHESHVVSAHTYLREICATRRALACETTTSLIQT